MPADELDRVVADLEHGTTNAPKILRELRVARADEIAPMCIAALAGMVARVAPHARRRETGRRQVIGHDRPRCSGLDG